MGEVIQVVQSLHGTNPTIPHMEDVTVFREGDFAIAPGLAPNTWDVYIVRDNPLLTNRALKRVPDGEVDSIQFSRLLDREERKAYQCEIDDQYEVIADLYITESYSVARKSTNAVIVKTLNTRKDALWVRNCMADRFLEPSHTVMSTSVE